ncbi:MAG: signal peptidase I [Pirellula sp.]|nr:signal peptidase I [Pirellula sp.]
MRKFADTLVGLALALIVVGAWLTAPFAVVSGSMTPTLLGPHRAFDCARCGARNVSAIEVPTMSGFRPACKTCGATGPQLDLLPIVPGDRMLVDYTTLLFREPRRWEVVAFRMPESASRIAVKRIIGLPGETVELRDGEVYIDGRLAPKPSAVAKIRYDNIPGFPQPTQWKLAADEYFVLGDNPQISDDSRYWTFGAGVPSQLIVGKPFIVHFPSRTASWYGRPVHVPDLAAIRYIR